ncbi:MAG: cysteine synthase A [Bacilli bacterium]
MAIYKSISELVGNTPLVQINKSNNTKANIFAKVEYFNPTGSVKDRIAKSMIEDAEQKGLINKDTLIIEPTSGNTGIGLAAIATSKGYKAVIVMPDTMSVERRNLMKAYGAKVVLSDGTKGMKGAIEKANELKEENPNAFIPGQFNNPSNPLAHYKTTGPEIYNDLEGKVDVLVGGIGTGGTISGAGKFLKEKNPNLKIIGVEPASSPVLTKGKSGPHKIQGIGAGFVPDTLDRSILDEVITVENEDAFAYSRKLSHNEGILVGISSGAAFKAALEIAQRKEYEGKNIVVILPDGGDRYMSTPLFNEE